VLVGMASLGKLSISVMLVSHPQGILELTDVVGVGGVHCLVGESLNILSGSVGGAGECPPAMAEVVCDTLPPSQTHSGAHTRIYIQIESGGVLSSTTFAPDIYMYIIII
jgi:hypothetical protein